MKKSLCKLRYLIAWVLLVGTATCHADVVVVMHGKSGVERLNREQVVNIFLGRYRKLDNGQQALPVDLPGSHGLRTEFYRRLVDKTPSEINAYWAHLIFSGKVAPPLVLSSEEKLVDHLDKNRNGIAYADEKAVDDRLRVVFRFIE